MFVIDEIEGTVTLKTDNGTYSLSGNVNYDEHKLTYTTETETSDIQYLEFYGNPISPETQFNKLQIGSWGINLDSEHQHSSLTAYSFKLSGYYINKDTTISESRFGILNHNVFFGLSNPRDASTYGVFVYKGGKPEHLYAKPEDVPTYSYYEEQILSEETLTNDVLNGFFPERKNGDTVVLAYYDKIATFIAGANKWILNPFTFAT